MTERPKLTGKNLAIAMRMLKDITTILEKKYFVLSRRRNITWHHAGKQTPALG